MRALASTTFILVVGCGGGQTESKNASAGSGGGSDAVHIPAIVEVDGGPAWLRGTLPEDLPADAYAHGIGVGETPRAARQAAEAQLATALLGPPDERPDAKLPVVFASGENEVRSERLPDGRTAILLAVSRSIFAMRLQTWLENPPSTQISDASTPHGSLQAAVDFLTYQRLQAFGCKRQRAIVGSECEPPDTTMADRQVAAVAAKLTLRPSLAGGIPFRNGGAPLRPAAVIAEWKSSAGQAVPWPELPLRFSAPTGVLEASSAETGPEGYAAVRFGSQPAAGVQIEVSVDRQKLLGKLASAWPEKTTTLSLRQLAARSTRVAVFLAESIAGEDSDDAVANRATAKALKRLGYRGAHTLDPALGAGIDSARRRPDALELIADKSQGAVDLIVVGDAQSVFASRMGARSVWHEATCEARIYDVWSGGELGAIERSARAAGLGDSNAGRKALRQLGSEVAEAVDELLRSRESAHARAAQ